MWTKLSAKCDAYLMERNFQTRSGETGR
ncbi:DUF6783 domain-containing protein [[Clostridium] symbiosum]